MPLLGLSILAQGLADLGGLLFNRRQRSQEWEMAIASTFDRHIVVVGLGHLGYRVVPQLHAWGLRLSCWRWRPVAISLRICAPSIFRSFKAML